MKIHKIQRISCVIPFYSSFFILVMSMIELKRYKASFKRWLQFYGLVAAAVALVFALNNYLLSEQIATVKIILSAVVTTVMNFLLVEIQVCAWKESTGSMPENASKKAFIGFRISLSVALTLILLVVCFLLLKKPHPYRDYTDVNGAADTSLALITQEDLLTGGRGIYGKNGSGGIGTGEQTHVESKWSRYDYDRVPQRWGFMTGVQTLQATKIDIGTVILNIDSILTAGNAEIVIIVDDEYYCHVPINESTTVTLEDVAGKTVLVHLGCEAAEIEITVERTLQGQGSDNTEHTIAQSSTEDCFGGTGAGSLS